MRPLFDVCDGGVRILQLHPGPDTAGQSMAGKEVLEAAGHEVQVFAHSLHRFGYRPYPDLWQHLDDVREWYAWADVVVYHNDPTMHEKVSDGSSKRLIVHHHGTRFRSDPERLYRIGEEIGALQVVSTIDLLLSVPSGGHAEWMPQVLDPERLAELRTVPKSDRLTVSHAPTNRQIKGTRSYIKARRELHKLALFDLIVRQSWWECQARKARSHIFVDQLNLGYGNNAIEAWALGLPVLAGATPHILARMRQVFGELPFYETSAQTIVEDIRGFIRDADLRSEWATKGRRHMDKYHAPDAWRERAVSLYSGDVAELVA